MRLPSPEFPPKLIVPVTSGDLHRKPSWVRPWAGWAAVLLGVAAGLAGEWQEIPGGRFREVAVSDSRNAGFRRLDPAAAGLAFTNRVASERYFTNQVYLNGSGVALGDVDGDGWCDVYLCGIDNGNALFRNMGGWRFEEVTRSAGVACAGIASTGALLADADGDGDLDLVVNSVGQGTRLFLNNGRGQFTLGPDGVFNVARAGTSSGMADFDLDGDLDLYVANYRTDTIRDMPNVRLKGGNVGGRMVVTQVDGRPTTEPDLVGRFELSASGGIIEHGEVDVLLRNEGNGRFVPLSFTNGVFLDETGEALASPPYDWGLTVMFRDLNADGRPDLYVCNDFETPDRCWINQGDGRFRAIDPQALRHTSIFSMGVDVGDLNRDGHDDLLVSDMLMQAHASRQLRIGDVPPVFYLPGVIDNRPQYSFNTLQLNRGDGTYAEIGWYSGIEASGWTWCPVLLDVDLDGFEDVLFPTGHEWDMMNGDVIDRAEVLKAQQKLSRLELLRLRAMFARFDTPNVVFRNRGDLHFEDVSARWGMTEASVSQGAALGDLDHDGDLDVVFNNLNGPVLVYQNLAAAPRVAVRLKGRPLNTQGVGARICLLGGAVPQQSQVIVAGGHYLSGDEALRVFAAGSATNQLRLQVTWPSGTQSVLTDVRPNRIYEVDETGAAGAPVPHAAPAPPWFEEVAEFQPVHREEGFDDLSRQPLIPFQLNALGPGVAWLDFDADGWDDLVLGAGKGSSPQLFRNDGAGRLLPSTDAWLARPVTRDLSGVVAAEGSVMFGSANYEDGLTNGGWIRIYDLRRKASGDSLLGPRSSTGPLAVADIDADGDLDMFVGGRAIAGRYPEPAESMLLRNEAGRLVPMIRWERLGLVSGALFSDLNGDGWTDLALACEWGPIRVFHNDRGAAFREVTETVGLAAYTGWWRGVTAGDFDGDGRLDLVAGNWGQNSRYAATPQHPARLHYGDLDGDLALDVVESRKDPDTGRELPTRGLRMVGIALPWLKDFIGSYEAYGKASVMDLYGDRLRSMTVLEATTLASMVFLNRGDRFEARPLPLEAQWSPAFAACVADFDGDGFEDVFLSQNFFGVSPDGVRQDAGRGLWLRGDGRGGFQAVAGQESGVRVYGEQRGAAVADYNADGRVDLVVTQNGNAAKLFRNSRARPGLRVRLEGPTGNRQGTGAVLRLGTANHLGPARELHAGSGYWSQDSLVAVLNAVEQPSRLEIRWPGGKRTMCDLPPGAKEVAVDDNGAVRVLR